MGHKRARGGFQIPGWAWWLVPCVLGPVVVLNLLVAWLGDTQVPLLSFDFLATKARALGAYVQHRPSCVLDNHPPLEPLVVAAERRHGIPTGLLQALVQVESETHTHRISAAGAMGPGQLMPDTARQLRVDDPFDPGPAIEGSARYLAEQLRRFDDVRLAVAAYNAGPGAVNGHVPHNGETEFYVAKVMTAYARLRPPPAPTVRPPLRVADKRDTPSPVARTKPEPTPRPQPVAERPVTRPTSKTPTARAQKVAERPQRKPTARERLPAKPSVRGVRRETAPKKASTHATRGA
ncbi:lytic transglycosylase domain-containing protein [Myxococcaceae bacterium JPH2]|nr:lytic transglycosylase domain-containing protein [Myxococcaceae bacterium JPH2]